MSKKSEATDTPTVVTFNRGHLEVSIPVNSDSLVGNLAETKQVHFRTDPTCGTSVTYAHRRIVLLPYGNSREVIREQLLRFMEPTFVNMAMQVFDRSRQHVSFTLPARTRRGITRKVRNGASGTTITSAFATMQLDALTAAHKQKNKVHPTRVPGGKNTYREILPGFARSAARRTTPMRLPA